MVEMPCCRCSSGVAAAAAAQGQAMALAMAMAMPASSGGMQQGFRHLKHHRPWAWTALAGLRLHPRSCSYVPSEVGAASKRRARGPIMAAKKAAEGRGGGESEREIIISSCLRTELAIWMVDFLPRSMAKWDFLLFLSRFGFVSGEGKFSMCGLWSSSWPPRRLPKVRGVVFLLFGNRIG